MKTHLYQLQIAWTGNLGTGTSDYKSYSRDFNLLADRKPLLAASADLPFRGDGSKYNPEDMLLASVSSCHMLWYLHFCATAGVIVTDYIDNPTGTLTQDADGGGRFTEIVLHPEVTISDSSQIDLANSLHAQAHEKCFISNTLNLPVLVEPNAHV